MNFGLKKKDKNEERFEKEILCHLDAVFRLALFYVHNYDEASDLTQETILKALRFFHTFQEGTNGKAWLFKILNNTLINAKIKERREKIFFKDVDLEKENSGILEDRSIFFNTPEAITISEITREEIMSAVDHLPHEYRTAVILCDVEEFSYKEIGEITDCPIGTVMSRLYRGRTLLKEKLKRKFENTALQHGVIHSIKEGIRNEV